MLFSSDSSASAISLRRRVHFFDDLKNFRGLSFLVRKDYIVSYEKGSLTRKGRYRSYIYVDAIRLKRGKCYDLISTSLLRLEALGPEERIVT